MNTVRTFAAVADHDQPGFRLLQDARQDLDAIDGTFYRTKVRNVDQDRRAVRRQGLAQLAIDFRLVFVGTNEVGNNFDPVEAKMFNRRLFQIIRNSRHAVRLLQGVFSNRQIRTVGADQRDVRTVQRGNYGQATMRLD